MKIDPENIARYVWIGRKDKDWYKECQETFEEIFGAENLGLVTKIFAATSINSSLKSNLRLFERAKHEIDNGLPVGAYLPNIQKQLHQIRAGKPLTGRKINNFALAMSGDKSAVVVDIWLMRAFKINRGYKRHSGPHAGKIREGGPSKREYDQIENYIKTEASAMGLQPRELCAMIWSGIRISRTGNGNTRYTTILKNRFNNLFSNAQNLEK